MQRVITILRLWLTVVLLVAVQPLPAGDELVVYSGRSDKFVRPVMAAFTRETGIRVVLHNAKSTGLLNKLRVEVSRTDADLYISNDAGNLQIGSDLGLFQPLPAAILDQVPDNYRAADGNWIGLSARARVLVVNSNTDSWKFIRSVFDLADPRLDGRLAITNSTNESYIAGVTVYLRSAGPGRTRAWLEGMKRNTGGKVYAKHSKIVKSVASGKKDVGLVNHYYIYRHLAKDPQAPIRILLPDQSDEAMGLAWNVAGIAISKYTKRREQAEKLVAFLVSPAGQRLFAEANREYPVRTGIPASPEVPPMGSFRVADIPMRDLAKYRNETINLLEEVGMP